MRLRVARPCLDIEVTKAFYTKYLEMNVLSFFEDHKGFDGIILGQSGLDFHLEFTKCLYEEVLPTTNKEDLLVFFEPEETKYLNRCEQLESSGAQRNTSFNSYWDKKGRTYLDPNGYRLVIYNGAADY